MAVGKAWEAVKSEGKLASLQLKQVVWVALVKAGLQWPLHHPKLAGAPRRTAEVWEKRPCYLECGKESGGFMYNFHSSESKIVINKPKEARGRRIKHECLSFLRSWKLRGIQIASFTVGFDSRVTWPKLTAVYKKGSARWHHAIEMKIFTMEKTGLTQVRSKLFRSHNPGPSIGPRELEAKTIRTPWQGFTLVLLAVKGLGVIWCCVHTGEDLGGTGGPCSWLLWRGELPLERTQRHLVELSSVPAFIIHHNGTASSFSFSCVFL